LVRGFRELLGRRPASAPKYYVYVSDTKADMLYAQIPRRSRDRIAAELKVDLKVLALSLADRQSEETRYSKTQIVCDYLRRQADVGTVEKPSDYFSGVMTMRWGPLSPGSTVVYFGGSKGPVTVGLGGSMRNVLGQPRSWLEGSDSLTTYLWSALSFEISREMGFFRHNAVLERDAESVLWDIEDANAMLCGPEERLEFLARRLLADEIESEAPHLVVLGSPIYVALADRDPASGGAPGTRAGPSA
jgi:Family of unknown function (DUF7019)